MPLYFNSKQRQILIYCLILSLISDKDMTDKEIVLSQDLIDLFNKSRNEVFHLRKIEKDILKTALDLLDPGCFENDYDKAFISLVQIL